jgi:hypothetical protein
MDATLIILPSPKPTKWGWHNMFTSITCHLYTYFFYSQVIVHTLHLSFLRTCTRVIIIRLLMSPRLGHRPSL